MKNFTYNGEDIREYPTLGVIAEPGESYPLEVDAPEDGRWVTARGKVIDPPEPTADAPPIEPTPDAPPADTTTGA